MAIEKLSGKVDGVFYAPLDLFFIVRRVLRQLQPRLVIVAETEIWPNLFRETKRIGAGLLLVNGRISDQSGPGYRRLRFFFRAVLRCPDRILCQSAADRDRFMAAGAPDATTIVNGNLKYDFVPGAAELPAVLAEFLARVRPDALVVAGSTREEEEEPVIEAFRLVAKARPRALLVVAPRHPQRFDQTAELLARSGISFLRRSELELGKPADFPLPGVLLLDSLGELASLYRSAHVVFVGGSLNGWGGHNVLEPALYGRPVVVGPHMQNFRAVAETLLSQGGMVQLAGGGELGPALLRLIENPRDAKQLGERGRDVAEKERGATARAVEVSAQLFRESRAQIVPGLWRRILLGPLAWLWGIGARVRLTAYRKGWLHGHRLNAFTICVGNLTTGGVGKTPFVAWLVERLTRVGHSPGVLTRGYGRSSSQPMVVCPGDCVEPADCGDEALVLLRHFERAGLNSSIGIGANRYEIGRRVLSLNASPAAGGAVTAAFGKHSSSHAGEGAPDVLVLDDGFQHLALERDVDLALIDVTNPFGGGTMLPLGRLREPQSSLGRASAIVLTRTEPGQPYEKLEARLRMLNPTAPIFRSWTRTMGVVSVGENSEASLSSLAGRRILAFCGLGNPESFWRVLRREGTPVVQRLFFGDHHRYSMEDLLKIAAAAAAINADLLLTTEKDVMNLPHRADGSLLLPAGQTPELTEVLRDLHWLRIETHVEHGDELLRWIEEKISGNAQPRVSESQARAQVRA
jgi:3-deoxy-D-manno-octulosonic-acid transferase